MKNLFKTLIKALAIMSSLLTLLFGWLFIERLKLPYNEAGRYFDEVEGVVYHADAAIYFGLILIILLVSTSIFWLWARKR